MEKNKLKNNRTLDARRLLLILFYIVMLIGVTVGAFVVLSSQVTLPGGYRLFSVATGSMEPEIPTGSLLIIKRPQIETEIETDMIITFEEPGFTNKFITHRVYEVRGEKNALEFATKGDANDVPDNWVLSYGRIQGVYVAHIPYLGNFIDFIKTPTGVMLFVIIPALLFIFQEIKNIFDILVEMRLGHERNKKYKDSENEDNSTLVNILITAVLISPLLTVMLPISQSYALYNASPVTMSSSTISTGSWDGPEDVVINEIMWMGSSVSSADEWIELRNMTDEEIDLTGWRLEGAGTSSDFLVLAGTIPANGYFLLSNYDPPSPSSAISNSIIADQVNAGVSLNNEGEILKLYNDSGSLIDETPDGAWASGTNGGPEWKSMERNEVPSTGWHQCDDTACNNTTCWDTEGANYGTPKAPNLSDNDPSISLVFPLVVPENESADPQLKEPTLNFYLTAEKTAVGFTLENVERFSSIHYEIVYTAAGEQKGMLGDIENNDKPVITRGDLSLGTCSATAGLVCTYDTDIHEINISVSLKNTTEEIVLKETISYE